MALNSLPLLRAAAITATLALAPTIGVAAACNSWDHTVSALGEDYGENLAAEMVDSTGRAIHLFLNANSGSWTLTITAAAPDGDPL